MRNIRVLAAAFMVVFSVVACGARLDPNERQQAANAQLNSSGGGGSASQAGGSGDGATPGGATTGGGSSSGGSSGTSSTGTTGTQGTQGTQGTKGTKGTQGTTTSQSSGKTSSGKACPSGTDTGLTSSTINLGLIADTTGPVPGLFIGAEQGAQAYANYINSNGGICGHSVHFDFADGGTNCGQNKSDVDQLVKKDFALVGTFSLYDGCGAEEIKKNPNVPDIHVSLDPSALAPANHFDLEPGALGYATGMWKYYAGKLGSKVKKAGTIYEQIPSAEAKQNAQVKAAKSQGWNFVRSIPEAPTTGDFQSDFQKMCGQDHIQTFFVTTENAQNAATMVADEKKVAACAGVINVFPIAYDQAFLTYCQQVGCDTNRNPVMGWNEYSLFFNSDEAGRIPEVKTFQTWFAKTNGNKPANLYAMFAWGSARMFQQAFENAGKSINRQAELSALRKIKNFTSSGLLAPSVPSSKGDGVHCYIAWKLSGQTFSRQDDPGSGYRCDGSYIRY